MLALIAFLCYVAAAFFLGCLVFTIGLGSTDRLAAGLFCAALGLMLLAAPAAAAYVSKHRPS